jgi:hypothetical protein
MEFATQLAEAIQEDDISEDKLMIYKSVDIFFTAVKENLQDLYAIQEYRNTLQNCLKLINESPKKNLKEYARNLFANDEYLFQVLSEEKFLNCESSIILDVFHIFYSIATSSSFLQKVKTSKTFSS